MKQFGLKALAIGAVALCTCVTSHAQQLVKFRPGLTEGYMVLRDDNTEIETWSIELFRENVHEDGTTSSSYVDTYTLTDKNFMEFDKMYWSYGTVDENVRYYVNIEGFPAVGDPVTEGPVYLADFMLNISNWDMCWKSCVNSTYAYTLEYMSIDGFTPHVTMKNYYILDEAGGASTRVYEYMSTSQYNAMISNPYWQWYYNLPTTNFSDLQNQQYVLQFYYPSMVQSGYHDRNGNVIFGTVYAVQKSLGLYQNQNIWHYYSGSGGLWCSEDIDFAVETMNINFDFSALDDYYGNPLPDLDCAYGVTMLDEEIEDASGWIDCISNVIDPQTDIEGFDSYVNAVVNCMEPEVADIFDDTEDGTDYSPIWPKNVERMLITRIDQPDETTELIYKDMFDSFGNLTGGGFSLNKGLYKIHFIGENKKHWPAVVEIKEDLTDQMQQEILLNASVFPNPVGGNAFSVSMTYPTAIPITYKLYDSYGQLRVTENFTLSAGTTLTEAINSSSPVSLPDGVLLHHFILPDGSIKAITTLKIPGGTRN